MVGIDQYGNEFVVDEAAPKRSLLESMGRNTAVPMYRDKADGTTVQVGYVVKAPRGSGESEHWVTLYHVEPWERPL